MKRVVIVLGAIVALAIAAPASAAHEHYLVTPGRCVEDIASGQTQKGSGEGGYHQFHQNVHLGQPGMKAFANPNNPIAVYKTGTGPECQ